MQATTPMDPRVLDAMMPLLLEKYGNPHSGHLYGEETSDLIEKAREQVGNAHSIVNHCYFLNCRFFLYS